MTERTDRLDDFLVRLDDAQRAAEADRGAYLAWLGQTGPAIARELTEALPASAREAGLRFVWEFLGAEGLTASDTEPPPGTWVRDSCGREWVRYEEGGPVGWEPPGGGEHETWRKIAGNYGPVTVLEWGDAICERHGTPMTDGVCSSCLADSAHDGR